MAAIAAWSGDLTIEFGERAQLQFLQLSSGHESWRFSAHGRELFCIGRGQIIQLRLWSHDDGQRDAIRRSRTVGMSVPRARPKES